MAFVTPNGSFEYPQHVMYNGKKTFMNVEIPSLQIVLFWCVRSGFAQSRTHRFEIVQYKLREVIIASTICKAMPDYSFLKHIGR